MNGYGKFAMKNETGQTKIRLAHRVAYELEVGHELPHDTFVLHSCDVRECVRFDHLFLGNQKMNMHDASQKGRLRFKRECGRKLWASSVLAMRHMVAKQKIPGKELARVFRMSPTNVSAILTGRAWAWVGGPLRPRRKRLGVEEVLNIREFYASGVRSGILRRQFGVGESQILRIIKGEDWPMLGGPRSLPHPLGRPRT